MILLIEDDDTTRELTATVLRWAGHTVQTAVNGRHGLVLLESIEPSVIFCDLDMPHLDGWAFRRLQLESDRHRCIPFVVVSAIVGTGNEGDLHAAMTLRKPVEPEELLRCASFFDAPIRR